MNLLTTPKFNSPATYIFVWPPRISSLKLGLMNASASATSISYRARCPISTSVGVAYSPPSIRPFNPGPFQPNNPLPRQRHRRLPQLFHRRIQILRIPRIQQPNRLPPPSTPDSQNTFAARYSCRCASVVSLKLNFFCHRL